MSYPIRLLKRDIILRKASMAGMASAQKRSGFDVDREKKIQMTNLWIKETENIIKILSIGVKNAQ